jgi:hypothetical protein
MKLIFSSRKLEERILVVDFFQPMRLTLLLPAHFEGRRECATRYNCSGFFIFSFPHSFSSFACSDEAHFQSMLPSQWQSWKRT